MTELSARIKAIQDVVRDALDQDLSLEGDADLAEVLEVLRFVVRERDGLAEDEPESGDVPPRASQARVRRRGTYRKPR
jgi:hypothetical protein